MGQTLSEPVCEKHTAHGEDDRLAWGVSEMQGWRLTMEDAHAHILDLVSAGAQPDQNGRKTSFFAVYDGHGGSTVARFAGDTVHSRLAANDAFKRRDYEAAAKRAFLETDEDLRANPDFRGDPSGCTAVSAIFDDKLRIICANAGDSRAVMSLGGEAKPLSFDHKPTNKGENARIVAAGGFVEFGRVNGNLALSRALGDFEFKQSPHLEPEHQIVTADPDITVHEHTDDDEFLVIACDGIWDVLSSQQVIDFVRRSIADGKELHTISEELMDRCLAPDSDWGGVGCDNMTALIVAIKGERSTAEWYDWIKQRVDSGKPYNTPKEIVDPFSQGGSAAGPRGALAGPRAGGAPGTFSMALGGGGGSAPGEDEDEDDDDGEELDLPTIQAALKARMAELEREGARSSGGAEGAEISEIEMSDDVSASDASATAKEPLSEPPKTSLSPPESV